MPSQAPFDGSLYALRGRNGRRVKCLWHEGIGLCLLSKRIEPGALGGKRTCPRV
ncbi:IS66 family insertion sequence element accessory protein TnpB [Roseomonas sp. HF4]|uniref:IS66 family insertion sequence element accessory protein TnpB n=1 Tax=Roseomonas sp. HF4 TaxID=2562313 RepID=UPI0010C125C6|nr:IS66 family insertion sequence element accessory protein TnpB [Roseomonas sp. HF4]